MSTDPIKPSGSVLVDETGSPLDQVQLNLEQNQFDHTGTVRDRSLERGRVEPTSMFLHARFLVLSAEFLECDRVSGLRDT